MTEDGLEVRQPRTMTKTTMTTTRRIIFCPRTRARPRPRETQNEEPLLDANRGRVRGRQRVRLESRSKRENEHQTKTYRLFKIDCGNIKTPQNLPFKLPVQPALRRSGRISEKSESCP